jgi:hypothetical protein
MDNMTMTVEGDELVIRVDLSVPGTASASGKTIVLASSRGNADVPGKDGYKVGLNVFRYPA